MINSLLSDYEAIRLDAARERNFMLRLRDRELTPQIIAGFVAQVASRALRIALPGYRKGWYPATETPPAWAPAFDVSVEEDGGGFHLPPDRAARPELAGFWQRALFQSPVRDAKGLRPLYRPCLPVIELPCESLSAPEFADHTFPEICFSADIRRRKQPYYANSVRYVDARLASGDPSLFVLYQDPAWFMVLGSDNSLECALAALRDGFTARGLQR